MKKIIYTLLIFLTLGHTVYGQQKVITGTVIEDANSTLMPGINVAIKGTNTGTFTDIDGKFSISVKPGDILVFSFVGYETQDIKINSQTSLTVRMKAKLSELDEVVVVGYGIQKKVSVVGAISTVKADELKQSASANLSNAIAGRISGVMTKMVSGQPGNDDSRIFIRGMGTFNDNTPLVLVDGIERSFNQIDPDDIESFSVMKDASATAVYGVRGANGVILVTTKRGQIGKPVVSFSAHAAIQTPIRTAKPLDAYNFALLKNEAIRNDNGGQVPTSANYYYSTDEDLQHYLTGDSPYTHPNNDLIDMFLRKAIPQYQTNLNIRGGNKIVKYFVSLGFLFQDGIYKEYKNDDYSTNANYRRLNLRSNLDFNVTKTTVVGVDLNSSFRSRHNIGVNSRFAAESTNPEYNNMFELLMRQPANYSPLKNPDGTYGNGKNATIYNPLQIVEKGGYYHTNQDVLQGTFRLDQDLKFITKGLTFKAMLGINSFLSTAQTLSERPFMIEYDKYGNYTDNILSEQLPVLSSSTTNDWQRIYGEVSFNYNRTFGDHAVTALALYNQSQTFTKANVPTGYLGFVGRLTYGYKQKYLAEINLGYNGSNQFAEGRRYSLFPAISAGWVISEEKFWKNNISFINFLKIRGSYGEVGNDKIGNYQYLYLQTYNNGNANFGNYNFGVTPQGYNGLLEGRLGNDQVTWERAKKTNVGMDMRLFNGRFTLNADYFHEIRNDILMEYNNLPMVLGISYPPGNIGIVRNQGGEIELGWNDKYKDFNYFIKGNMSYARNKIIENGEALQKYPWMSQKGQSIGQHYGLVALGLFKSQEEIDSAPQHIGTVQIGDIRYKDMNEDGIIDEYDECPIGYSNIPRIQFGLTAGFSYKGFDFSMLWQGAAQFSVYFSNGAVWEFRDGGNAFEHHLGRFNPEDPSTWDTATYPRLHDGNFPNNHRKSTYWLKKGDYLRLKNVEIGYSLPKHLFSKIGVSKLRFFVSGTNLLTFDHQNTFDPETENERAYNYPQMSQYTFGVNIQF